MGGCITDGICGTIMLDLINQGYSGNNLREHWKKDVNGIKCGKIKDKINRRI